MYIRIRNKQGLSPLVPPVPVVVPATVVAASVSAVVPVGRVLMMMALVMVDMLSASACVALATRAAPVAGAVAAAISRAWGMARAGLLPLLQGVVVVLLKMVVAPAGRPDPVLGRRVPRPTVSLRLPPMEEGVAKVTFCSRGAAG